MDILPIKFISETDQPIFGVNLLNLAKLERVGFLVPSGIAVSLPEIVIRTILEYFESAEKEVFQQRLELVKGKLHKIPLPEELDRVLSKEKSYYLNGEIVNKKERLWKSLTEVWLNEIYTRIWRNGFTEGIATNLCPQAVFFVKDKFLQATAHLDPNLKDTVIKGDNIAPWALTLIDKSVTAADKRLYFPQVYKFIITSKNVYLVGVSPFTQSLPVSQKEDIIMPKHEQNRIVKSAVKVFFNLSGCFALPDACMDGILVEGEKIKEFANGLAGIEETIFKLTESALSLPGKPVIFKLPDIHDGDIRGTLRLVHQKSSLDQAVKAFLFVRNKKNLLNVELAVPLVRSADELVQIKQELGAMGISRKGTLKLWLEVSVPENLINLEDYLAVGIDGVILDLDELHKNLGGYDVKESEFYQQTVAFGYKKLVQALIKFVQPSFKMLHKVKMPILVRGELCLHPDVLDCLLGGGVWGIVANTEIEAESLPEHLHWSERRMVIKHFA